MAEDEDGGVDNGVGEGFGAVCFEKVLSPLVTFDELFRDFVRDGRSDSVAQGDVHKAHGKARCHVDGSPWIDCGAVLILFARCDQFHFDSAI